MHIKIESLVKPLETEWGKSKSRKFLSKMLIFKSLEVSKAMLPSSPHETKKG